MESRFLHLRFFHKRNPPLLPDVCHSEMYIFLYNNLWLPETSIPQSFLSASFLTGNTSYSFAVVSHLSSYGFSVTSVWPLFFFLVQILLYHRILSASYFWASMSSFSSLSGRSYNILHRNIVNAHRLPFPKEKNKIFGSFTINTCEPITPVLDIKIPYRRYWL